MSADDKPEVRIAVAETRIETFEKSVSTLVTKLEAIEQQQRKHDRVIMVICTIIFGMEAAILLKSL